LAVGLDDGARLLLTEHVHQVCSTIVSTETGSAIHRYTGTQHQAVGLDDSTRVLLTEHVHQVCATLGQRQGQLHTGTQLWAVGLNAEKGRNMYTVVYSLERSNQKSSFYGSACVLADRNWGGWRGECWGGSVTIWSKCIINVQQLVAINQPPH
jgi:hypothetical protein